MFLIVYNHFRTQNILHNTRQQILDDWMLRLTEYTIFMFWGPQNTKMTLKLSC